MIYCPKCGEKIYNGNQDYSTEDTEDDINIPHTFTKKVAIILSICIIIVVIIMTFIFKDSLSNYLSIFDGKKNNTEQAPVESVTSQIESDIPQIDKSAIAENYSNSVLYIEIYDLNEEICGTASGFIIYDDDNGFLLVTNYHVIDGASKLSAFTPDKSICITVQEVLAYDIDADIAVLKCDNDIPIPELSLSDSDKIKQGDEVFVIGYPLGITNTFSTGVVSSLYVDENNTEIIQITAPISNGSSGSAVFNNQGEVIGIVSASYTNGQNMNIAISSNEIRKRIENINDENHFSLCKIPYEEDGLGISYFNYSGGGIATENQQYKYFVNADDRNKITQIDKFSKNEKTININDYFQQDVEICGVKCLNTYGDRLFFVIKQGSIWDLDLMLVSCSTGRTFGENLTECTFMLDIYNCITHRYMVEVFIIDDYCCIHYYINDNEEQLSIFDITTGIKVFEDKCWSLAFDATHIYYTKEYTKFCILTVPNFDSVEETYIHDCEEISIEFIDDDSYIYIVEEFDSGETCRIAKQKIDEDIDITRFSESLKYVLYNSNEIYHSFYSKVLSCNGHTYYYMSYYNGLEKIYYEYDFLNISVTDIFDDNFPIFYYRFKDEDFFYTKDGKKTKIHYCNAKSK